MITISGWVITLIGIFCFFVGLGIGLLFVLMSKKNVKKWEDNLKKSDELTKENRIMKEELYEGLVRLQKELEKIDIINGYRATGIVNLTQKDFDNIPTLNRDLEGFDTVSQAIVFQLKLEMGGDWYLLDIFKQDNDVNTGITRIELVESYGTSTETEPQPGDVGC